MIDSTTIILIVTGVVLLIVLLILLLLVFVPKSSCSSCNKSNKQLAKEKGSLQTSDIITGERLLKLVEGDVRIVQGKYERVIDLLDNNNSSENLYVVTHQSDATISEQNLKKHVNVKHWFGCNVISDSPRLSCIPLGIADSRWPHGDIGTLCKIIHENNVKDKLCYLNIKVSTNSAHRRPVQNLFARFPWVSKGKRTDYETYLRDLSQHKYALAPEGNGPDTHRAWECLYLGVIPIIKSSVHQKLCFDGLPIFAVHSWEDVTEEKLTSCYEQPNPHELPKLRLGYWRDYIRSTYRSAKK